MFLTRLITYYMGTGSGEYNGVLLTMEMYHILQRKIRIEYHG